MRYHPISASTYVNHRKLLAAELPSKAMAVIHSNDIMPTNADGSMPFRQNNDLLYLCGIDQEETVLLLFPDATNPAHWEILFVKETSAEIAIWEGEKFSKDGAEKHSGEATVMWVDQYKSMIQMLIPESLHVFLTSNEHLRQHNEAETREMRMGAELRQKYPLYHYQRLAPIMHRLRSIKSREEIDQVQHACKITESGFRRVLKAIKPGIMEYEIEAEYLHDFVRKGSRGFAYTPIIASGFNACVLHYIENNKACEAGDVILMDVGAEYGNYASDMTRCVPVSGKFTSRQKDVYNAVLRVMRGAQKLLKPGVMLSKYHSQVGVLMQEELVKLGLLTSSEIENQDSAKPAYKKYFMHGTSHFLGLDVHDVGLWHEPIQAGMIFTVEPGIYIREEKLGIRLENDILITENGFIDLMASIPIEADDIEALMA